MYKFISPEGETIRTKSIKEFAEKYQFNYSSAIQLSCGQRQYIKGWFSTHPKAKKKRMRFLTVLVNTVTSEQTTLGSSLKEFADKHNLCMNEVCKLVNGKRIRYRNWMLKKTYDKTFGSITDTNI